MSYQLNKRRVRKLTRKPKRTPTPTPTTYMGIALNRQSWPKIVGYAAYDAGLPIETIDNPQCQRAYIAAAVLTGGSNNE